MTPREKALLDWIASYSTEKGYAPNFAEMVTAMGVSSKSRIFDLVTSFERQGFVRRTPHRNRSIEVIARPTENAHLGPRILARLKAEDCFISDEDGEVFVCQADLFRRILREVLG